MRFLITGASGWIGFRLTQYLSKLYGKENIQLLLPPKSLQKEGQKRWDALFQQGFDILVCDLLNDPIPTDRIKPFDILFHLAAFIQTEVKSDQIRVNDIGTQRLLDKIRSLLKGKRLVFSSSILSLDRKRPDNTPMAENYSSSARSAYGRTKYNAESMIQKMATDVGFRWLILRLPTVYGPDYRQGGMFDTIPKGLMGKNFSVQLPWPGRTSLIYIEDAVVALHALGMQNERWNEIFHLDSGENPTLDELIEKIAGVLQIRRERKKIPLYFWKIIRFLIWLPGLSAIFPFSWRVKLWRISLVVMDGLVFNNSKFIKTFPFSFTPLEQGLADTYRATHLFQNSSNGPA